MRSVWTPACTPWVLDLVKHKSWRCVCGLINKHLHMSVSTIMLLTTYRCTHVGESKKILDRQSTNFVSGLAHFREKLVLDRAVGTTWCLPEKMVFTRKYVGVSS